MLANKNGPMLSSKSFVLIMTNLLNTKYKLSKFMPPLSYLEKIGSIKNNSSSKLKANISH